MFGWSLNHARSQASFLIVCLALAACSGSATLGGPAAPEAPQANVGVGGALDAPPAAGTTMAAAQPLSGGFPAPENDPTGKFFTLKILEEKPVCRLLGKDLVQYKIRGFVVPNWTKETPESVAEFLGMGSLRVVDQLSGKYLEVPLSSMATYDEYGMKTHKLGYFEFVILGSDQYHLNFFPVQPVSATPVETPWTACPDTECAPTKQTLKIFANSETGDLKKAGLLAGVIPVCQVGGGALDWPVQEE